MIIPSLKSIDTDDLNLLYVDAMREWAKDPDATRHADLALAITEELERRGKTAPDDEVRAEIELVLAVARKRVELLKQRVGLQ